MKVTREKTENSQAFLTIEMEPAEVEAEMAKSYQRLVNKADVPGFRKGKAPRPILERHLRKGALLDDALEYLIPRAYDDAVKGEKLEAIARPDIEITSTEPVVFKATVPLKPTVELGDYRSIRVAPEEVKVTEEDVDHSIEHLRHEHSVWEPVEREVRADDSVTFDIESTLDGADFIKQQGAQYRVTAGSENPMPGFAEQLVGMKRDEEKDFNLKYPADYARTELAGKEAIFKVKVTEIKQEVLPELNDDFAKQVAPELKDIAALRERLATNLKKLAQEKADTEYENKVVDAAIAQSKIEFPPVLLEIEMDRMVRDFQRRFGIQDMVGFLERMEKTPESFREGMRPQAENRVKRALVLAKVAGAENISVSDSEIDEQIKEMAGGPEDAKLRDILSAAESRESIRDVITARKAVQKLIEIAKSAPASS